jgi:hypothetical protein
MGGGRPAPVPKRLPRMITARAARFLAVFRVVVGLEFLWAFLDKTFGLGYATPAARAWINGGSPIVGIGLRAAAVSGR